MFSIIRIVIACPWRASQGMRQQLPLVAVIIVLMRTINQAGGQGVEAYEQSPVNYSTTEPRDAIAKLEARVAGGDLKWTSNGREIVQQLLKELSNVSSVRGQSMTETEKERIKKLIGEWRGSRKILRDNMIVRLSDRDLSELDGLFTKR